MVKLLEVAIKNLLEEVTTPLIGKDKVTPIFGTGKPPFVTYTITPIGGGTVKQSQVEVKSIGGDIDQVIEIREAITNKLDILDSEKSLSHENIVLRSKLAGGGQLFNDSIQMWEMSSIFIITWRCKN